MEILKTIAVILLTPLYILIKLGKWITDSALEVIEPSYNLATKRIKK